MDAFDAVERGLRARDVEEARIARRSEVAYRKQIMDQNLAQMGKKEASGLNDLLLQNTIAQQRQLQQQLFKQETFQVLDNYLEDGNTDHLNRWYQQSPILQERDPSIARYDRLSLDNPTDRKLLNEQGITDDMIIASGVAPDELLKRLVKVTKKDGSVMVSDMAMVYGATGYTQYRSAQKQAEVEKMLALESKKAEITAKYARADRDARWEPSMGGTGMPGPTARVRDAEAVGEARTRIEQGQGTAADYALIERHDEETMGNTPGKQRRIDQEEQNLFRSFGGEQGFYSQQFEPNTQEFNQAMRSVRKIEALAGVNLSNKQVETIGNIRKTIAAGQRAAGLQPGDVGLVDNVLKKLGAYVSDDAMGAEARSAWAGIRNQLLHAFAGSAMNEGELERWGEQFGNLYQQGGHVMTTLANALDQLGGELDSLRVAMPEASFHVRLGSDVEKLNTIIANISAAAATLSNKANPQGKMQPMTPSYPVNPPGYQTGQREVQQPVKSEADKLREMLLQRQQRQGAN